MDINEILKGAKNLMNNIDEKGLPRVNHNKINDNLNENINFTPIELPDENSFLMPKKQVTQFKNLNTSKMDPRILESLKNQPIQIADPNSTINGREIDPSLFKKNTPKPTQQRQVMNESYNQPNNGNLSVNPEQLKQMVKDCLLEFMTTTFTKNLSETVIKSTIKSLLSEGKITAKTK